MFDDFAREDLPDPLLKALEVQEKLGRKVLEAIDLGIKKVYYFVFILKLNTVRRSECIGRSECIIVPFTLYFKRKENILNNSLQMLN